MVEKYVIMARFVIRRILWMLLVLLVVSFITFTLMHLVPGGPWSREKALAPAVVAALNARYGLDKPFFVQYANFLLGILHGNLGISYTYQDRSVTQILMQGFPKTAVLGTTAFVFAMIVGISLGMAAALRQNTWIDYVCVMFSTIFASVPGFVLGILLMIVFSVILHWFPTGGWGSPAQVVMPAIALAALPAAFIARITRASTLETMRQDYVRTARSKGLLERVVLIRHILRNSLIPVVTVAGPQFAALVTGSVIVETIFSIPGIGRLFVQAVFARDYGLIMGTVLFYSFVISVANLVVDILYGVIDPRIRYD
jgi:oligopeptide transport system permease protein